MSSKRDEKAIQCISIKTTLLITVPKYTVKELTFIFLQLNWNIKTI